MWTEPSQGHQALKSQPASALRMWYGGCHRHGGSPKWMVYKRKSWNILLKNGWWLGVPLFMEPPKKASGDLLHYWSQRLLNLVIHLTWWFSSSHVYQVTGLWDIIIFHHKLLLHMGRFRIFMDYKISLTIFTDVKIFMINWDLHVLIYRSWWIISTSLRHQWWLGFRQRSQSGPIIRSAGVRPQHERSLADFFCLV